MNVFNCNKCDLSAHRTNIVSGRGNHQVSMMIIGDYPKYADDRMGIPFSSKAGDILMTSLNDVGLDKKLFYFTNIIKCKPLIDKRPINIEINNCLPYLINEINIVKPKIVLLLGKIPVNIMLNGMNLHAARKQIQYNKQNQIFYISTFSPTYIYYNIKEHTEFIRDLHILSQVYQQLLNPYFIIKDINKLIQKS